MDNDNSIEYDIVFDEMDRRLHKIDVVIHDPYKSVECKYSLVEDIVNGRY